MLSGAEVRTARISTAPRENIKPGVRLRITFCVQQAPGSLPIADCGLRIAELNFMEVASLLRFIAELTGASELSSAAELTGAEGRAVREPPLRGEGRFPRPSNRMSAPALSLSIPRVENRKP